jgi:hypothetical protein
VIVCVSILRARFRTSSLFRQNSPYAEVRAVVDNHDDPTMPASTFRAWFIGTIFVAAGYVDHHCILRTLPKRRPWRTFIDWPVSQGFINQFFSIRQPGITVSANVAQLLAFPLANSWKRSSRPGSSPPSATHGVSTPGSSISRSTW